MSGSDRKEAFIDLPGYGSLKLPKQTDIEEKNKLAVIIATTIRSQCNAMNLETLLCLLDCQDCPDHPVSTHILSNWQKMLEELKGGKESEAQELLRANWICASEEKEDKYCMGISTDVTNLNVPCFKYACHSGETPVSSGKCDVSSMVMPMGLEIKSNKTEHRYQVIAQMFERAHMTATMAEHLRRIVEFCSTGSDSWMLLLNRTIERKSAGESVIKEDYKLIKLNGEDILHCWRAVTSRAMEDPLYFAHPDAFILQDALASVGLPMSHCLVKLQKITTSRIYYVHGPVLLSTGKSVTVYQEPSLVIKVNCDNDRSLNERTILKRLKNCSAAVGYAIGMLFYETFGDNASPLPRMDEIYGLIRKN